MSDVIDKDQLNAEIAKCVDDFREYSVKVVTGLDKAILKGALLVERTAKELVSDGRDRPSEDGAPPRVDTGRLRASITHRMIEEGDTDNIAAEIGTNVEYAYELEFGSSQRKWKHPFMYPALASVQGEVEEMIAEAVANA